MVAIRGRVPGGVSRLGLGVRGWGGPQSLGWASDTSAFSAGYLAHFEYYLVAMETWLPLRVRVPATAVPGFYTGRAAGGGPSPEVLATNVRRPGWSSGLPPGLIPTLFLSFYSKGIII